MTIRKYTVPVLTDGSGNATVYSPYLSGYIESIQYVKTDFTNGVDLAATAEATGEAIWSAANMDAAVTVRPRAASHTTAGVAATYDGTRAVLDRIALGRDRLKFIISSGGAAHVGAFVITMDDPR